METQELLDRAYALKEKDALEDALRECEAAIRLAPDFAEAHNLRGMILEQFGRNAEAVEAYREAIHCDPSFEEAMSNLNALETDLQQNSGTVLFGRPFSIYLATLWSIARAAVEFLTIIGLFEIYRPLIRVPIAVSAIGAPSFDEMLIIWTSAFDPSAKFAVVFSIVQLVAFSALSIGIFLRRNWGRVGFLALSLLILIWNIFSSIVHLLQGSGLAINSAINSLAALALASWYFRRPTVLDYFQANDISPRWARIKIGKFPLDLDIALTLIASILIFNLPTLIYIIQTSSR